MTCQDDCNWVRDYSREVYGPWQPLDDACCTGNLAVKCTTCGKLGVKAFNAWHKYAFGRFVTFDSCRRCGQTSFMYYPAIRLVNKAEDA